MTGEPWVSLVDLLDEYDFDAPAIARSPMVTVWHEDESCSWTHQEPPTFFVTWPRFGSRDEITGYHRRALPAAQQYGLKLTAWCEERKRQVEPLAGIDYEPF